MDYETYEKECAKIKAQNQELLTAFRAYLEASRLSQKTVKKHLYNIDFYINEFLLYEELQQPEEGVRKLNYFFGYWFIRKAMWASVNSIKENIASLKKFYAFLEREGRLDPDHYLDMLEEVKESRQEWIEGLIAYDTGFSSADMW